MLEKLQAIKERWEEVEAELSNPETINDMKRVVVLSDVCHRPGLSG